MKTATTLALQHFLMQRGEIPASGNFFAECFDLSGVLRVECEIRALQRIGLHVIELIRIDRRVNELEAPAPKHHDRCNCTFSEVLADRFIMAAPLSPKMRHEPMSVERIGPRRGWFATREFDKRGQQIEMRYR